MLKKILLFVFVYIVFITTVNAAVVVAPSTALPDEKESADIVCDGKDDQVELLESIKIMN